MSSSDRFQYETATALTQQFLDACHDNLTCNLEMVTEIDTPVSSKAYSNPSGTLVELASPGHGLRVGNMVTIESASDSGLVGQFRIEASGFTLSAFRIDKGSAVSPSTGTVGYQRKIYASDRNKYVGGTFYEALTKFPPIVRSIGEWLAGQVQFPELKLRLSNVDQRFNRFLPEGVDFKSWIGRTVVTKLGLRDVASTYTDLFRGTVTPEGGAGRDIQAINLVARDNWDKLSVKMPTAAFTEGAYPSIQDRVLGKALPLIYGDWTTKLADKPAAVPAFPVNGADFDVYDPGGARNNLQLVISVNDNRSFDQTQVWLKRSSAYFLLDPADIVSVAAGNNAFSLVQNGITSVDGNPYVFETSDEFYVQVTGKAVPGGFHDNFVEIARQILIDFGGAVAGDFDATWDALRDKASPAESNVAAMKCRVWQQDLISTLEMALSLLEQVRAEAFIDRLGKIKINALHFDAYEASPAFNVRNWDIVKGTWTAAVDLKNKFNRAKGYYSRMPDTGKNQFETDFFKNQSAIDQESGRVVEKGLVFPNHYETSVVEDQVKEIVKLASGYIEVIKVRLTWRSILQDIGGFLNLNVKIGSSQYTNSPGLIREIGIEPDGSVDMTIWALGMINFPGHMPGYAGIVGGSDAVITQG